MRLWRLLSISVRRVVPVDNFQEVSFHEISFDYTMAWFFIRSGSSVGGSRCSRKDIDALSEVNRGTPFPIIRLWLYLARQYLICCLNFSAMCWWLITCLSVISVGFPLDQHQRRSYTRNGLYNLSIIVCLREHLSCHNYCLFTWTSIMWPFPSFKALQHLLHSQFSNWVGPRSRIISGVPW